MLVRAVVDTFPKVNVLVGGFMYIYVNCMYTLIASSLAQLLVYSFQRNTLGSCQGTSHDAQHLQGLRPDLTPAASTLVCNGKGFRKKFGHWGLSQDEERTNLYFQTTPNNGKEENNEAFGFPLLR